MTCPDPVEPATSLIELSCDSFGEVGTTLEVNLFGHGSIKQERTPRTGADHENETDLPHLLVAAGSTDASGARHDLGQS